LIGFWEAVCITKSCVRIEELSLQNLGVFVKLALRINKYLDGVVLQAEASSGFV
jgi:hypothetical protein